MNDPFFRWFIFFSFGSNQFLIRKIVHFYSFVVCFGKVVNIIKLKWKRNCIILKYKITREKGVFFSPVAEIDMFLGKQYTIHLSTCAKFHSSHQFDAINSGQNAVNTVWKLNKFKISISTTKTAYQVNLHENEENTTYILNSVVEF